MLFPTTFLDIAVYSEGLMIGRIFASEIWGAYFREGFFFGGGGAYDRNFTVFCMSKDTKQCF